MIGFYNYTVWLTYLSLISAGTGIMISLYSHAHPFIGMFFLLVSGLCDAFDGKGGSEQEEPHGDGRRNSEFRLIPWRIW